MKSPWGLTLIVLAAIPGRARLRYASLARALHAATRLVGHPQIRNRGTVGGSIALGLHGSAPAGEFVVGDGQMDAAVRDIDLDGVAFFDQSNRTTFGGFR